MTTQYVVGFYITTDQHVLLIRKSKPGWQCNKINGLGGKVEPGEIIIKTMLREFEEESGIMTTADDWYHFCTWTDSEDNSIHFFISQHNVMGINQRKFLHRHHIDEGELLILPVKKVVVHKETISNVNWLLPMGVQCDNELLDLVRIVAPGKLLPILEGALND